MTHQKEFPKCMSHFMINIFYSLRNFFRAVLYALAKQGRNLGAYKLARLVYEKLHTLHIPSRYQASIEMGDLTIRAKPFSDAEVLSVKLLYNSIHKNLLLFFMPSTNGIC